MVSETVSPFLMKVYRRLLDRYGPQHWWPAEEPFEVIVGAILTQSAAWVNVEKAIANLKAAGGLTPHALHHLSQEEVATLVHPSGYYNAKARKLKAFVRWLEECYGCDLSRLFAKDARKLREELLDIHGIGPETADSIILYAANKPVFVIDAYTRRIVRRLGVAPARESYDAYQALFMDSLTLDARLFNEYHALLVQLGKEVCRPVPRCARCCLMDLCYFHVSEPHAEGE